jgi:large subunit ribosomal protein L30
MAETKTKTPTKTKKPAKTKMIHIQYYRSKIATPTKHKLVVKGLGFTRLNQIVERVDTDSVRGMVKAIPHLVRIVENK